MKLRVLFAIGAACLMAACTPAPLLSPELASQISVQDVAVSTTNFGGVSGRSISVPTTQVRSDIERALSARLRGRGAPGGSAVSVNVDVTRVALVSPGQSLLVGGVSSITATVSVVELATGAVLLAPTSVTGTSEGYAPGGILGATSRGTPEADYAQTVASFAENVTQRILGNSVSAATNKAASTATPSPIGGGRNELRETAWQF